VLTTTTQERDTSLHHLLAGPSTDTDSAAASTPLRADEAEIGVLGSCLVGEAYGGTKAAQEAQRLLTATDFYHRCHRSIFSAISRLIEQGSEIDPLAVKGELKRVGEVAKAGGEAYLVEIFEQAPTAANLRHYAKRVLEAAERRRLVRFARGLSKKATEPDLSILDLRAEALEALTEFEIAEEDRFRALPLEEIALDALDLPQRQGLLANGELNVIAGVSGTFKTSCALELAVAVGTGTPALGHFPTQGPANVLVLSEEDSASMIRNRCEALAVARGGVEPERIHVLARTGLSLDDPTSRSNLEAEVKRVGAKLLIIDPWAEVLGAVNENDNTGVRAPIKFLRRLNEAGVTILILHHSAKSGSEKDKKPLRDRALRGASALGAAARGISYLESISPDIVHVRPLKWSRGELPAGFDIQVSIDADDRSDDLWSWASLQYVDEAASELAAAKAVIWDYLGSNPVDPTTRAMKTHCTARGVSPMVFTAAQKSMCESGEISYKKGPRGAKLWRQKKACRQQ